VLLALWSQSYKITGKKLVTYNACLILKEIVFNPVDIVLALVIFFVDIVFNCHKQHQVNPNSEALLSRKAALRRSLFTIGVLCKHFDFDDEELGMRSMNSSSIEDFVFEQLMYFLWHEDGAIRQQALTSLGKDYSIKYL